MIFNHTWEWLVKPSPNTGRVKTQTSRIAAGRVVYQVGGTYAVQRGRGKPAVMWGEWGDVDGVSFHVRYAHQQDVPHADAEARGFQPLRIRVADIRQQDVRLFTHDDVLAEGFASYDDFIRVWCGMHDKSPLKHPEADLCEVVNTRPAERYTAWVLTFEVATSIAASLRGDYYSDGYTYHKG